MVAPLASRPTTFSMPGAEPYVLSKARSLVACADPVTLAASAEPEVDFDRR